jgi:hypothetical protein
LEFKILEFLNLIFEIELELEFFGTQIDKILEIVKI